MRSSKASSETATAAEPPVFSVVITPHRALDSKSFRTVMTLCCLATIVSSIPFIVIGAWPVAGFFGLDLVALYAAFHLNFRSARSFEEVVLTPIELLFRRVTHRGERREWRFNPLWTKLDRETDDEFGCRSIALVSRGERVVIARDLSPHERASLADALSTALSGVKRGF